ncbi:uncharacterized protein [Physcomitrium patens]|uniref:uncharacterized protein isoform X2 n=1 Tax=Physcomitrium patens TaxID=3218 RepID=UPI003CCDAF40
MSGSMFVFCWHFGKQASQLPQAWDFGWFFKFLTFCGFSFQMIALMTSLLSHLFPEEKVLKRSANDMSCASFEIVNVVTLVYWAVTFWTSDPLLLGWDKAARKTLQKGLSIGCPLWLTLVLNIGIVGISWADILITERNFRRLTLYMTLVFGTIYTCWVHVCEARNEEYPHPFIRPSRQPEGTLTVSAVALLFVFLFHKIGSKLASRGSSPLARKIKLV